MPSCWRAIKTLNVSENVNDKVVQSGISDIKLQNGTSAAYGPDDSPATLSILNITSIPNDAGFLQDLKLIKAVVLVVVVIVLLLSSCKFIFKVFSRFAIRRDDGMIFGN